MKFGIVGCGGRMGRLLMQLILEGGEHQVAGGTEREGSPLVGQDLGVLAGKSPIGLVAQTDPRALFEASDVVIDFTSPAASRANAHLAVETQTPVVIGTTGLSPEDLADIRACADKVAILQSFNMSLGINLMAALVRQAAAGLPPEAFDIEIVEMHHKHKVDAPSGTAILLGEAAAEGRKVVLADVTQSGRDGHTGERRMGDIGFAALRGGDVAGEHTVILAGAGERIELTHRATARSIFASGGIRAAAWLAGKKPGLYAMTDVLGL